MKRDGRGVVRDCRIVLDSAASDGALPSDHFALYAEVQLSPLEEELVVTKNPKLPAADGRRAPARLAVGGAARSPRPIRGASCASRASSCAASTRSPIWDRR